MTLAKIKTHALLAAAALALPGAALAQNDVTDQANQVAESAEELQQEANKLNDAVTEDAALAEATANDTLDGDLNDRVGDRDDDGDEGKWGLLGLLGLAGLLGMKRRDNDVHVHRDTTVDRDRDGRV